MRNSQKSFLVLTTIFLLFLFSQISFAQDFNEEYNLSGGEGDEANFFLQKAVTQDSGLRTKAEQFNGKLSGNYEGQRLSCPYAFERDLFVGSKGEDVRLLQVLLNSDRRTLIATSGPGSLGVESDTFGEATKEAVKKFQALFIEYTGVANGRFGPRTRTVMNAICNGDNKPSDAPTIEARQNRNIYENVFSVQRGAVPGGIATVVGGNIDTVAPRISLSANVSTVKMGETFKVILNASEEIVPITPEALIVEGGIVKEIRKLSKTSYTATISISEEGNVKKVLVQIEADKVEDLAGNKNENASNEISVKVISENKVAEKSGEEGEIGLNSLLDKIIASAPSCTYNGSGILITVSSDGKQLNTTGCAQTQTPGSGQTYNCNGQQIPVTQPCQQQTQTVCTTSVNPFTGAPQQQCQQVPKQQAEAMQKAQEQQQMGQLLGNLFRNFGGGQNQNGQQPGGPINNSTNPFTGFPQQQPPAQQPPVKDPSQTVAEENRFQAGTQKEIATLKTEIKKLESIKNPSEEQKLDLKNKKDLLSQKEDEVVLSQYREEVAKNKQFQEAQEKACKSGESSECTRATEALEASNNKLGSEKKKLDDVCTAEKKAQRGKPFSDACENALGGGTKNEEDNFFAACPHETIPYTGIKYICFKFDCKTNVNSWYDARNKFYGTTFEATDKYFYSFTDKIGGKVGVLPKGLSTQYLSGLWWLCNAEDRETCVKSPAGSVFSRSGKLFVQKDPKDNTKIETAFSGQCSTAIQPDLTEVKP